MTAVDLQGAQIRSSPPPLPHLLIAPPPPFLGAEAVVQSGRGSRAPAHSVCWPYALRRRYGLRCLLLSLEEVELVGVVQDLDHARIGELLDLRLVEAVLLHPRLQQRLRQSVRPSPDLPRHHRSALLDEFGGLPLLLEAALLREHYEPAGGL